MKPVIYVEMSMYFMSYFTGAGYVSVCAQWLSGGVPPPPPPPQNRERNQYTQLFCHDSVIFCK